MEPRKEKNSETNNEENGKKGSINDDDENIQVDDEEKESAHDSERHGRDKNVYLRSNAPLLYVDGLGSMSSFEEEFLGAQPSSSSSSYQHRLDETISGQSPSVCLLKQQGDDGDVSSSSQPSSLSLQPHKDEIVPHSIDQTTATPLAVGAITTDVTIRRTHPSNDIAPTLLESCSSAPGAYHVGGRPEWLSRALRSRPSVPASHRERDNQNDSSDNDRVDDEESTSTSVLATVLPRYGATSGIPAALTPARLQPTNPLCGSETSQLTMDDTDLNSLVPADSTPDRPSTISPRTNDMTASGSTVAIVEAHVVSEGSLEARVAAKVEARLQQEFRGRVEREVNRKLGSIATAEVISAPDDDQNIHNNVIPSNIAPYDDTLVPTPPRVDDGTGHSQGTRNNSVECANPCAIAETETSVDPNNEAGTGGGGGVDDKTKVEGDAERRRWLPRVILAFLLGLAAAGSFVAVRIVWRDDESEAGGSPSPSTSLGVVSPHPVDVSTMSPNPAITASPTPVRDFEMRQILLTISDEDDLDDQSSPQYHAFDWLVNRDGLQLDPIPTYDLYQRYVVAVLYFATQGERWKSQCQFLNSTSICEWNMAPLDIGLFCHEGTQELQDVMLANNRLLNGPLPPEIGYLSSLDSLVLSQNSIGGSIPSTLGLLQNLTFLDVDENRLSGTLPQGLDGMHNLRYLTATNNVLTGQIPNLTMLSNLEHLYLDDNRLTGSLPTLFGNSTRSYTKLEVLWLSQNQISGPLPTSLCNLTKLRFLSLYGNHMAGQLPSCLGDMESLESVYLDGNDFTGSIDFFCPLDSGQEVTADCYNLVQCSCCTSCCDDIGGCARKSEDPTVAPTLVPSAF